LHQEWLHPQARTLFQLSHPRFLKNVRLEDLKEQIDQYEKRLKKDSGLERRGLNGVVGIFVAFALFYMYNQIWDVTSDWHKLFSSLMRQLNPETARTCMISLAYRGYSPTDYEKEDPYLVTQLTDEVRILNPIGLAAGFDREASATGALMSMGFGMVEVGTVGGRASSAPATANRGSGGPGITYHQGPGANTETVQQNLMSDLDRYDSNKLASRGVLGICVAGSLAEIVGNIRALGPFANYFSLQVSSSLERPLKSETLKPSFE
jgi:hypothetical protein